MDGDIEFQGAAEDDPADRPQDSIDVYAQVSSPTADDEFLQENNLGLGVYGNREYWQQVESYEKGLFSAAAFARRLRERAVYETIGALGREGFGGPAPERTNGNSDLDTDTIMDVVETHHETDSPVGDVLADLEALTGGRGRAWDELPAEERERYDGPRERGEAIWAELTPEQRGEAVRRHTGVTGEWRPPHWRMLEMRHEASRSRGGRLIDNVFARVEEVKQQVSEGVSDSLLGGES